MAHKLKVDSAQQLYNLLQDEETKASLVCALKELPPTLEECVAEVNAPSKGVLE